MLLRLILLLVVLLIGLFLCDCTVAVAMAIVVIIIIIVIIVVITITIITNSAQNNINTISMWLNLMSAVFNFYHMVWSIWEGGLLLL